MAGTMMGQQVGMISTISSSQERRHHVLDVSDEKLLDMNNNSIIDGSVERVTDAVVEEEAPICNISVITVDYEENDSHSRPSTPSCGELPNLSNKSSNQYPGVGKGNKKGSTASRGSASSDATQRTSAATAAVSAVGMMCSQVVPPIRVGAGACGAMNPLVRSPLHEDAPYQHLADAAVLRDFHDSTSSPQTLLYVPSDGSNIATQSQQQQEWQSHSQKTNKGGLFLCMDGGSMSGVGAASSATKPLAVHIRSSSITFKAGASSLRALTRNNRAPKVERFNYAKALLRSDDELEKLAQKIRTEINESELFELALAAEKAAEAGEDKFTGRASTFGATEQHSTPIVSTYPPATATTNATAILNPSRAPETPPQSKSVLPPERSALRRATTTSIPTTPIATPSPKTPLKMDLGSATSNRFPTAGPGGSAIRPQAVTERSISEPQLSTLALLDSAIVVTPSHKRQQPEKRSMGVHSLRDVSEVIPHFKELHGHMRTHLYRERVEKKSLFFNETLPPTPLVHKNMGWGRFQNPRNNDTTANGNGSKSNRGANAKPQHQRSRSFFDDIAQMRLPGFGQQRGLQEGICSSRSFDTKMWDDTSQSSPCKVSPTSASGQLQMFGKKLSCHISPNENQCTGKQTQQRVPHRICHPVEKENNSNIKNAIKEAQDVSASTAAVESRRCLFTFSDEDERPSSLVARLPRRPEPFELEEFQAVTAAGKRDRTTCSSETTSVVSVDDADDENAPLVSTKDFPHVTDLHSPASPASSPLLATSKKFVFSALPDDAGLPSVSLLDDGSACPTSPLHESSLETFIYQSYLPLDETTPAKAPLTPKNNAPRADSEFNTPAHLRMIKRLHRNSSAKGRETDGGLNEQQEQTWLQPRHHGHAEENLIATPAMKFGAPAEPNSIVDDSSRDPSGDTVHERAKVPSLHEMETRFLTLPTIHSTASDLTLEQLSQKFVRRKLRTQWPSSSTSSVESTTLTTSAPTRLLQSMEKRETYLLQAALSVHDEPFSGSEKHTAEENNSIPSQHGSNVNHRDSSPVGAEVRSDADQTRDLPVYVFPLSEVGVETTSAASEDKMSLCHSIADASKMAGATGVNQRAADIAPSTPQVIEPLSHEEFGSNQYSLQVDSKITNTSQSKYERQEPENENMASPIPTLKDSTTSSGSVSESDVISPLLKPSTETWEERFAAELDAIPMVNSILTMTSSNVKDTSEVLAEMTSDSQDFVANSYDSCSSVGRHLIGSQGHPSICHSLPSTDENFKAAVEGVLSHLTLSPRRQQLQSGVFLPEAENKEFLTNYFYCTKKEGQDDGDAGHDNSTAVGVGGGLSWAEPCNGQESHCYLIGVDTVCSGFTYLFPTKTNIGSAASGSVSGESNFTRIAGLNSAPERLATQGSKENLLQQQPKPPQIKSHADIDWQHQQQQSKASWLGMFQRAASQRFKFQFQSENELEKSKHPFNPPCLSRRVVPPNETR